jgi:hypothetical protein
LAGLPGRAKMLCLYEAPLRRKKSRTMIYLGVSQS